VRIVTTACLRPPNDWPNKVTAFVQELRRVELHKVAGISETLDWVSALVALGRDGLTPRSSTTRSESW
jgi:MoxR-like ATPase